MALVSGGRSTLNPDAPVYIPAAFRQVEDFSPEWWELVKTSPWFSDYWFTQHQEEESFGVSDADDDDIAKLLPESFDLSVGEELPNLEAQLEELVQSLEDEDESALFAHKRALTGLEMDTEALMKNLNLLKSSKEKGPKPLVDHAKYCEKPPQCVSPKCSPRRIHQPR